MGGTRRILIAIAGLAYGASLLFQAFSCGEGEPVYGYDLLFTGWAGLAFGEPRWLANPMFLAIMIRLGTAGENPIHRAWLVPAIVAALLGIGSLLLPADVCSNSGSLAPNQGPSLGAFLWVFAIFIACVVCVRQAFVQPTTAPETEHDTPH